MIVVFSYACRTSAAAAATGKIKVGLIAMASFLSATVDFEHLRFKFLFMHKRILATVCSNVRDIALRKTCVAETTFKVAW